MAVETSAAFATSRMVTLMVRVIQPYRGGHRVSSETARSIDEEKILDNAEDTMIFPIKPEISTFVLAVIGLSG